MVFGRNVVFHAIFILSKSHDMTLLTIAVIEGSILVRMTQLPGTDLLLPFLSILSLKLFYPRNWSTDVFMYIILIFHIFMFFHDFV